MNTQNYKKITFTFNTKAIDILTCKNSMHCCPVEIENNNEKYTWKVAGYFSAVVAKVVVNESQKESDYNVGCDS